ncbi:MAG: hypothetical protein H6Q67_1617 [Firmicutes bacterium]|nr:hypothetical protein [Bacillota bacterium]
MKIVLKDDASPLLLAMIDRFPNVTRGAVKSTGYWMMRQIQAGIASGAPGGEKYAQLALPNKFRQILEQVLGNKGKVRYKLMGKLGQAVKYKAVGSGKNTSVVVGWTSKSAVDLGEKLQDGFTRPVTPALRKAWDAAYQKSGMATRLPASKLTITTPGRPTIAPMKKATESKVMGVFEAKFKEYLFNVAPKTTSSGKLKQYPVLKEF